MATQDAQKQCLLNAVTLLRSAEGLIVQLSRNTTDADVLVQLNTEFSYIDSFISQLLHAQAITDDATFDSATAAIAQQASALQAEESDIKKVVADVATAAKISGYIGQAVSILATL